MQSPENSVVWRLQPAQMGPPGASLNPFCCEAWLQGGWGSVLQLAPEGHFSFFCSVRPWQGWFRGWDNPVQCIWQSSFYQPLPVVSVFTSPCFLMLKHLSLWQPEARQGQLPEFPSLRRWAISTIWNKLQSPAKFEVQSPPCSLRSPTSSSKVQDIIVLSQHLTHTPALSLLSTGWGTLPLSLSLSFLICKTLLMKSTLSGSTFKNPLVQCQLSAGIPLELHGGPLLLDYFLHQTPNTDSLSWSLFHISSRFFVILNISRYPKCRDGLRLIGFSFLG